MAAQRRRGCFLQGCHPREVTHALVDGSTPMHMLTAISGLCSFFLSQHMEFGGSRGGADGRGVKGECVGVNLVQTHSMHL